MGGGQSVRKKVKARKSHQPAIEKVDAWDGSRLAVDIAVTECVGNWDGIGSNVVQSDVDPTVRREEHCLVDVEIESTESKPIGVVWT